MIRHSLYRDILERLDGPLHEEAFERCAQNLLRRHYPTLVPIRGGCDGGMDGVTADLGEGAIALAATAGGSVIGNLTKNLKSIIESGDSCRRVLVSTSQKLSRRRQRNLRERAEELGFRLVQTCEQAGMADLLLDSPRWCKELLGLSGDPPPLSVRPKSVRPSLCETLVGREPDLKWLAGTKGDRLVFGQPGCGKSFLLSVMARSQGWLFVVTEDLGRISDGIRSQKPTALIVDDAHLNIPLLESLQHLRTEVGADIPIIAACWPSAVDEVRHTLNLVQRQVRQLGILSRPEMAEILKEAGIAGNETLVYHILNQSEGRPGLAMTLAHLCLVGDEQDLEDVILGKTLLASVRKDFKQFVSPLAISILAVLAVGGDTGMEKEAASECLGIHVAEIQREVSELAAGGVILETFERYYSVRPPELRYALIRDVFFCGANSLDVLAPLARVPNIENAAETLLDACRYGATIPQRLLCGLLDKTCSDTLWSQFASLGPGETRIALRQNPLLSSSLARETLRHSPEETIPRLLEQGIGDTRALPSHPDHPLRLLEDWAKGARPRTGEPIRRRVSLVEGSCLWLESGGDVDVGVHALAIAMTPAFEFSSCDPVLGDTITITRGLISAEDIEALFELWPSAMNSIRSIDNVVPLRYLVNAIEAWLCPGMHAMVSVPDDLRNCMRERASTVLKDIGEIGRSSPGLMHRVGSLAERTRLELSFSRDETFEILCHPSWHERTEEFTIELDGLARRLASEVPRVAVKRLARYEKEALDFEIPISTMPSLVYSIADLTENPSGWIDAIIDTRSLGSLAGAFVRKAEGCWNDVAMRCLSMEHTRLSTVSAILPMEIASEEVLNLAMDSLDGMSDHIGIACWRQNLPEMTIARLLAHEDASIASSAAVGVWMAEPKGSVPKALQESWNTAVVRGGGDDYWLGEILKENGTLAYEFLRNRPADGFGVWTRDNPAVKGALLSIDGEQRKALLRELPAAATSHEMVAMLVGDDVEAFAELLSMPELERYHLEPLKGNPNEGNWVALAKVALDTGVSPKEVVEATLWGLYAEWGTESDWWAKRIQAFEAIRSCNNERVREVGALGVEMANRRREAALKEERAQDTFRRP